MSHEISISGWLSCQVAAERMLLEAVGFQSKLGEFVWYTYPDMGVSENSVPLNPMVNDHYPY